MIFDSVNFKKEHAEYVKGLNALSFLSNLFSSNNLPYIEYRSAENIFCSSFNAENVGRKDNAFDAIKIVNGIKYGVGIKTFGGKVVGKAYKVEKVAEFNKDSQQLRKLSTRELAIAVSLLRNNRIESTIREYGVEKSIYHCIIRFNAGGKEKLLLKEFSYDKIDVDKIICTDKNYKPITDKDTLDKETSSVYFTDGKNYYNFNRSKSTLLMRFDTSLNNGIVIDVQRWNTPVSEIKDMAEVKAMTSSLMDMLLNEQKSQGKSPEDLIRDVLAVVKTSPISVGVNTIGAMFKMFIELFAEMLLAKICQEEIVPPIIDEDDSGEEENLSEEVGKDFVVLPLYSTVGKEKCVPEKSGLNQWNAGGRKRKFGEMYIPVPAFIHKNCPDFFPGRDKPFVMQTPSGTDIPVKLCQDGGKALMSTPNTALSEWFHKILLKGEDPAIITYEDLEVVGKDAVRVEKTKEGKYKFFLVSVGAWEEFKEEIEALEDVNSIKVK